MSKRTWHSGPPPHIGWWNASAAGAHDCWRWWNGVEWSKPAYPDNHDAYAAFQAGCSAYMSDYDIRWTTDYPANARVPRVGPRKKK